jgi:hypothetical protein
MSLICALPLALLGLAWLGLAWLGLASSQIGFENSELDIFKKKISQFNFYTQKNKV